MAGMSDRARAMIEGNPGRSADWVDGVESMADAAEELINADPTEVEVEAAAEALYREEIDHIGWESERPEVQGAYREQARAALLAARDARRAER